MLFSRLLVPYALLAGLSLAAQQESDVRMPLPGDLSKKGVNSEVANEIALILNGMKAGENNTKGPKPPAEKCSTSKNKCCIWYTVSDVLTGFFRGSDGKCNDNARAAVRLGFHDAGTWSRKLANSGKDFGGADGSIYLFQEDKRPENSGLETIARMLGDTAKNKNINVGVGDIIQFAAAHATVTCDLGPRMRTFVGRIDAKRAAPEGLLPSVTMAPDAIDDLFRDKDISPHDLAALLGAHSTAKQFNTDPKQKGAPLDSTPDVWDVAIYDEVLRGPVAGTFHLQSDVALANYGPVHDEWVRFVGDQHHWNEDYARAYLRLSLTGVNNINDGIFECTDALPAAHYRPGEEGVPDQDEAETHAEEPEGPDND